MPALFSDLRSKLFAPLSGNRKPVLHLGAFGKHPGWNDHIDDLGLTTEALLAAKQYLYVQGIGGLIDSGAWENLAPEDTVPEFKHIFIWNSGSDLLVGRMWASSDGKNRKRYPMILCTHIERANEETTLPWILSRLVEWENACRSSTSADQVRHLVQANHNAAQLELDQLPPKPLPLSFAEFTRRCGLEAGGEGLDRVVYATEAYLSALRPGKVNRKDLGVNLKLGGNKVVPQHLRLPADPADPGLSLRAWRKFLAPVLDPAVPALYVAPIGEPWIDLIAGPVTTKHLFCLKASLKALPLTSEVPFTITPETRARTAELAASASA